MTASDAAILQRARDLISQRRLIDSHLVQARGAYRERAVAKRKAIVAQLRGIPDWALGRASGEDLRHALTLAHTHAENDGSGRLIRWAEDRYAHA